MNILPYAYVVAILCLSLATAYLTVTVQDSTKERAALVLMKYPDHRASRNLYVPDHFSPKSF